VAGILLYLLATIPPFLVCVWLMATPGHFVSPFVPGTILAGVSDICMGLAYYFAALLLALHRGSWFGARILALFAGVHVSFYISDRDGTAGLYFHTAVEAIVLMGLVLFTAAWGAILSNGSFRARPWLGRLALIVAVFYGLCGLGELTQLILSVGTTDQRGNSGLQYKFTNDGVPLITSQPGSPEMVMDLAGHVIDDPRYRGRQAYENFLPFGQVAHFIGDPHGFDFAKRFPDYRAFFTYFSPIRIETDAPMRTQWFYLREAKYFVGIDILSRRSVQIVDRTGFQPYGTEPQPFQYDESTTFSSAYESPGLVNEGKTVYFIDLLQEKMSQLPNPDGAWIFHASLISIRTATPNVTEQDIVLVTAKELRVYDLKGQPIATLPFHYDVSEYGMINFSMNLAHDRFYVQYGGSRWIDWVVRHKMTGYFEEVDVHGNVIHSYVLPALPIVPPVRNWVYNVYESTQSPAFWYGTIAYQNICSALGIGHYDDRGINPFYPEWSHPPKVGVRLLLISLLGVPVALFLARRAHFSWGRAWAWAIFAFAFNIGGLLTFWLVADWPVRVKCPTCSRKRPVEETLCPHCQALWPAPTPSGIEILDEKAPVAETVA